MFKDTQEGQTNYCQQCEELQAQIARLRDELRSLGPRGFGKGSSQEEALSDTADNDKWLADVKAKHTFEALERLSFSSDPNFIWKLMDKYSNQAKKG